MTERPPFSALPLDPNGPAGNAWGLYGSQDSLGALNLLSPEVVAAAAASEIKNGQRVSLDWPLNKPTQPPFSRDAFKWRLGQQQVDGAPPSSINDDILEFNTQCSSQWDGFRHYGYQKAKKFYNNHTQHDFETSGALGIDIVADKGGIVGRGVLVDYAAHCERHQIPLDPFASVGVPLGALQKIIKEEGLVIRKGDILIIRFGFTAAYEKLSEEECVALAARPEPDFAGVESSSEMLRWIWESGIAAVAGDSPCFEQAPVEGSHTRIGGVWKDEPWEEEMQHGGLLHQWLLSGWGLPIGEMFDLEKLSLKCQELGRWSFFLASIPLKVPGGVASPPNAVAIF